MNISQYNKKKYENSFFPYYLYFTAENVVKRKFFFAFSTCTFLKSFFMMWQEFLFVRNRNRNILLELKEFGECMRWWLLGLGLRNLNVMYISERLDISLVLNFALSNFLWGINDCKIWFILPLWIVFLFFCFHFSHGNLIRFLRL